MASFVKNINDLAEKLDIIESANDIFDEGVIPVLEEIAALDLELAVEDLAKGTYFGNRKIDIDLALNNQAIADYIDSVTTTDASTLLTMWATLDTTVYYNGATVLYVDGHEIEITFMDQTLSVAESVSPTSEVIAHIEQDTAYAAYTENTSMVQDNDGVVGQIIRVYDVIGSSSNIERITLHVDTTIGGSAVANSKVAYWGLTTSAFSTLSMRASDIIKLGNDIDKIITLAASIDEVLELQEKIPEFVTNTDSLYLNIDKLVELQTIVAEIVAVNEKLDEVVAVGEDLASASSNVAVVGADLLDADSVLKSVVANMVDIQNAEENAQIAKENAEKVKDVTVTSTTTAVAGTPAAVVYNGTTNAFSFIIPQGPTGAAGESFTVDAVGEDRSLYDTQSAGFSFMDATTNTLYFRVGSTSGVWSDGILFGKGDTGATGPTGNGILSINFTSLTGNIATYTITYTDSTTDVIEVTNGYSVEDMDLELGNLITEELI